jgi:hypothetical protein
MSTLPEGAQSIVIDVVWLDDGDGDDGDGDDGEDDDKAVVSDVIAIASLVSVVWATSVSCGCVSMLWCDRTLLNARLIATVDASLVIARRSAPT